MKITEQIETINGVEKCYYNFDMKTLVVYYHNADFTLPTIQAIICGMIDRKFLHDSIQHQKYISCEKGDFKGDN